MTQNYKVVWIDDEYDTPDMVQVAIDAENHGLLLHGFRSFEEAFAYLEPNLQQVDAVLLDARFFEKREQVAGTEDLKGLRRAWDRLNQLDGQRKLPRFILSGQTRYQNDDTFAETYGRHYRKSSPGDVAQLWHDIKAAADQQPLTQLRHRYADAFAACTPAYVGEEVGKLLLDVLTFVHYPEKGSTGENHLNQLRRILEATFQAAHRKGFIPDECVPNGRLNLQSTSLFLAGKEVRIGHSGRTVTGPAHLSVGLSGLAKAILDLTNEGSHKSLGHHASYRVVGVTYLVMDVLVWFRSLIDTHPKISTNSAKWKWL